MNLSSIPGILALLVVFIAAPLNWLVTVSLWRLSKREPHIRVLRFQALTSLALSLIVTMFALIFLNNEMAMPLLDREQTMVVTRMTTLALSLIPALYWLVGYRKAR